MDSKDHNKVIAFDTLFSTNHIQMLKVILPYLDNQMQKSMAVYIKFLELNYTIDFYNKHPYPVCGCMERENKPDFGQLCGELLPYCTEQEKKQMEQIRGIFKSMEMYQELSKTMELMKDFMPDMDMSTLFQGFGDNLGAMSGLFGGGGFMNQTDSAHCDSENHDCENCDSDTHDSHDCDSGRRDSHDCDSDRHDSHDSHAQSSGSGNFDMMHLMMNMLSPEQKEMFELLGGGNNHAE